MEILLWLVPAALVTVLASWGAALAARREEQQRQQRQGRMQGPQRSASSYDDLQDQPDALDEGVSTPRPTRRPPPESPAPETEPGDHGGHQRRSA